MWIDVHDSLCRVTLASDDERAWLQRYLSFEDVKFVGAARGGGRRVSMFSSTHGTFPGGLLTLVKDAAARDALTLEVRDRRISRIIPDDTADLAWLRDYQREVVEACVTHKRGIVRSPTGCLTGATIIDINRAGRSFKTRLDVLVARLAGIWDISVPTMARSVDTHGSIVLNQIVRGWANGAAEVFELELEDGKKIRATEAHRFLVNGEYTALRDLRPGELISVRARSVMSNRSIKSITPVGMDETYDLEMRAPMNNYVANGMVVHNSGKGDMIVGLVKRLPGRWLFLVHRDTLVDQQAKRYTRLTGKPTHQLSRTPPRTWQLIDGFNLMTLQSLAAGIRSDCTAVDAALAQLDGVVIDEAHVAPAATYYAALQRCPAVYRFGFSGTPLDRTDNRSLMAIAALGKVIFSIKAKQLIDSGVLAAPRITMLPCRQETDIIGGGPSLRQRASAAKTIYDELVVDSNDRNDALVRAVKQAEKPCMVFVKIVEHGRILTNKLRMAGMHTEFVWGQRTKDQRNAAVERLERGDSNVLVASVVFQEGVDIPGLRSVVVGSGGKSVIATLQRVGRGMRTNGGLKTSFEVYDVLDQGVTSLEQHARRRMNAYVREGYSTVIKSDDGSTKEYAPRLMTRGEKKKQGRAP